MNCDTVGIPVRQKEIGTLEEGLFLVARRGVGGGG